VMRQHLANAIFRAVENDREVIRVTNNGITADIDSNGRILDSTAGFEPTVRTWSSSSGSKNRTFYTRYGDVFAYACALITLGFLSATFRAKRTGIIMSTNRRG
jgi:apolipoprotein N-acyltransferase